MVLAVSMTVWAPAQEKKADASDTIKVTGTMMKAGTADPNIKKMETTNDPKAADAKPPAHRGASTRGFGPGVCGVVIQNYRNLKIMVAVDGTWRGTLGPWDDGIVYTGNGATTLYAKAVFTDGSYLSWGPTVVNCPSGGRHYWELH
jgi:hypothetical protein